MTVLIAPDIKKTKEMINMNGDVIDPKTKRPVRKEQEYIPPPPHVLDAWKKEAEEKRAKEEGRSGGLSDKISKMIEDKVNKMVEEKIEEALKKLL